MINEDYVSFETAKLLKEKGFDEPCYCVYRIITKVKIEHLSNEVTNSDLNEIYANFEFGTLPTLQMAMKWLRKVHRLSIEPLFDYGLDDELWWYVDVCKIKKNGLIDTLTGYDSYEQACEAAIKYCLENLI